MKLLHGDCLEEMKHIEDDSIDMILTDPPYGTTDCKWDAVIPLDLMWEQLKRIIKPRGVIIMTAAQPFTSALIMSNLEMFKYDLVWDKKLSSGFLNAKKRQLRRHEDIIVFYKKLPTYNPLMETRGAIRKKGRSASAKLNSDNYGDFGNKIIENNTYYPTSILEISNANRVEKIHPTQKPVTLMEYLIKTYTNAGEIVLDFTMGSGTTGVACKKLNRDFIGIEKDAGYYEIACKRIEETPINEKEGHEDEDKDTDLSVFF